MRKISTLTLLFLSGFLIVTINSFSQKYEKYVVVFKNKKNSPYSVSNPSAYLSQKAVKRRTKYSISIDSSDLPVNPSYISKVLRQQDVTYLSQSKWLNQILIYTPNDSSIDAIKNLSFVKSVNPVAPASTTNKVISNKFNEEIKPLNTADLKITNVETNRYDYGSSYDQVHIHHGEFLHNKGFTGAGITIAIIDAGFFHYQTTIAFDSVRARNGFLGDKDFVDFDDNVNDDYNHGELCLSAIAANVPGVMVGTAPGANFFLLRSENVFSEYPIEEHNWAVAAEFADSAGADMISSSLGYNQFDDSKFNHTYDDFYKNATMVSRAATFAAKKGMIVTNSAGNEGSNGWKYIIFPADDDSVCAVAATNKSGKIASFSSYGYPGKVKPNISSVGSGTTLYSSSGLTSGSGTSFSNPNINGLIACLWQAFPKFNNMTILNAVYQSADRYSSPDNRYGYGIPNMKLAYRSLKSLENKNLYGNNWLFVNANSFSNEINFKLIGKADGEATLSLINKAKKVVATKEIMTELEEVYDEAFTISGDLPDEEYTLKYSDGINTKSITLNKKSIPVAHKNAASVISAEY